MSQVNFFMLQDDIHEFCGFIREKEGVSILVDKFFPTSTPKPLAANEKLPKGKSATIVCYSGESLYPALGKGAGGMKGLWLYSCFDQHVIDFDAPILHANNVLVAGRIYSKHDLFLDSNEAKFHKSVYRRVERWIKGRYIRVHARWWASPMVVEWSLRGGLLGYEHHEAGVIEALKTQDLK